MVDVQLHGAWARKDLHPPGVGEGVGHDGHDPRRGRSPQRGEQQVGQGERRQVVDGDVHLHPVGVQGAVAVVGSGVVDQQVQGGVPGGDVGGDAVQVGPGGEVGGHHRDPVGADLRGHLTPQEVTAGLGAWPEFPSSN